MVRKVKLPGHGVFWFLELESNPGEGALAPLEHCNEKGEIVSLEVMVRGESYAHVFEDGIIRRRGEEIGTLADLVEVVR